MVMFCYKKCSCLHVTDVCSVIQMDAIDLNELPIDLNDESAIDSFGTSFIPVVLYTNFGRQECAYT